jgi:uncharacterized protein YdhG (YjbR/CyaY superfamily)
MANEILSIDKYISEQSENIRALLTEVHQTIREALPDAVEKISWQMPTFWRGRNLIHFAAQKNHLGIYPGAATMEHFAPRLAEYKTSKGAVQFPYKSFGAEQLAIIAEIAEWCGQDETANAKTYEYNAIIQAADKGGGAYVVFPYDIREIFGKGRVKVHATFDGEPYDGSIVNMGVKSPDGSVCYIIGVLKDIRAKIGKQPGDFVSITIRERNGSDG